MIFRINPYIIWKIRRRKMGINDNKNKEVREKFDEKRK